MSSTAASAPSSAQRQSGNAAAAAAASSSVVAPRSQYRHPLPLVHPSIAADPSLSALYSFAWSLHLAILAIRAKLVEKPDFTRNIIDKEDAYLKEKIVGQWDPATKSVWVLPQTSASTSGSADADQAKEDWTAILWARGFFGKGSLSRSEPTWFQREKNRVTGEHIPTAEDVTSARRAERKIYKQQKAKERADEREKLAEAMLDKRAEETVTIATATSAPTAAKSVIADEEDVIPGPGASAVGRTDNQRRARAEGAPQTKSAPSKNSRRAREIAAATARQEQVLAQRGEEVQNYEHTQLQREEAFFLMFALGSLSILGSTSSDDSGRVMTLEEVWQAFLSASTKASSAPQTSLSGNEIRPDNPFLLSYVVYHHYRSLGWVVRNGIKFCVDWVLYKGADGTLNPRGGAGPVGGHAEFAVVVIPTYADPSDAPSGQALQFRRDWRWLNTVNRVCSGVKKTVILTFVNIPAFSSFNLKTLTAITDGQDFEASRSSYSTLADPSCLDLFTIREVSIKRFIPTRMRD